MIDVNQLRRNTAFLHDGSLFKVTEYSHNKTGRGKATIRVTVRNMRTGSMVQLTFNSSDRVDDVRLEKRTYQYSYNDGSFYVFMDSETFDEKQVAYITFDDHAQYLREGMEIDLLTYEGEVLDYELPKSMEFEVVESENAVAGDTATGATKEVLTDTGLRVKTPLFVKEGDRIKVNTDTGEYITRI